MYISWHRWWTLSICSLSYWEISHTSIGFKETTFRAFDVLNPKIKTTHMCGYHKYFYKRQLVICVQDFAVKCHPQSHLALQSKKVIENLKVPKKFQSNRGSQALYDWKITARVWSSIGLVTFEHTGLVLVWCYFLKEIYTRRVLVLDSF